MITQFRDVTYASQSHEMVIEEENDQIITINSLSLSFSLSKQSSWNHTEFSDLFEFFIQIIDVC